MLTLLINNVTYVNFRYYCLQTKLMKESVIFSWLVCVFFRLLLHEFAWHLPRARLEYHKRRGTISMVFWPNIQAAMSTEFQLSAHQTATGWGGRTLRPLITLISRFCFCVPCALRQAATIGCHVAHSVLIAQHGFAGLQIKSLPWIDLKSHWLQ